MSTGHPRGPLSLILKITLPTIALVVVASVVSACVLDWAITRMHEETARARARAFAMGVEQVYDRESENGHAAAWPFLKLICKAGEKRALVADAEGRVKFSAGSGPGDGPLARPPGDAGPVEHDGKRWYRWVRVVGGGSQCVRCHESGRPLGFVAADIPMAHLEEEAREQRSINLIAGIFLATALSILLVLMQYVLVYRPVRRLTAAVELIRSGDLSVRVPSWGNDEIGCLASSFNDMAASLQRAKRELDRTHRAELAQSEKLAGLGQLFTSIAHELKNQLAGILGAMKVIEAETRPEDPVKPVIGKVLSQMERMSKTAVTALEFARPLKPGVAAVDLAELLERTLFFIERQAAQQNVSLRRRYAQELPPARADEELMKQVFLNLLLNGIQAMPGGGVLEVETRAASLHAVEVTISDQGVGIAPENRERIFSPFFSTKRSGTGLGLYIARQIVETQQGEIRLESRPGVGTAFTVRLPASEAVEEPPHYVASC